MACEFTSQKVKWDKQCVSSVITPAHHPIPGLAGLCLTSQRKHLPLKAQSPGVVGISQGLFWGLLSQESMMKPGTALRTCFSQELSRRGLALCSTSLARQGVHRGAVA